MLAVGILGIVTMMLSATLLDKRGHNLSQASLVFEDILENMLRRQTDPDLYRNMTAPNVFVVKAGVRYEVNCSMAANTPLPPCTEMTCRISWNSGGRRSQTIHAYTFSPK